MRTRILRLFLPILAIAIVWCAMQAAHGQIPQTINYQGYLTNASGQPVNASVNITFRLYTAASGGSPVWTETQNGVGAANGVFNSVLGSVTALSLPFNVPYFLSLQVNSDAEMAARQQLSAVPYALRAAAADGLAAGVSIPAAQISGTFGSSQFAPTQLLPATACAPNQFPQWNGTAWVCASGTAGGAGTVTSITAGPGLTGGVITGAGTLAIDPASAVLTQNFFQQGGNTFPGTAILGSTTGAVEIYAKNTRGLRIDPAVGGSPNITMGALANAADGPDVGGATVSGGGAPAYPNSASANFATVAGGSGNTASGESSTVSGGTSNLANGQRATIGGGSQNNAGSGHATVAGGSFNRATNSGATIGGGSDHMASGQFATVSGGSANTASGYLATVAGGTNNIASAVGATVSGGGIDALDFFGNQANAIASTVAGGISNVINPVGTYGVIGGGKLNRIQGGAATNFATVAGGASNTASAEGSSIAGGIGNVAAAQRATVGGGSTNTAAGVHATVGGGNFNRATNGLATIGGGGDNTASGAFATIAGGSVNTASGYASTVAGGSNNVAAGIASTVGGGGNDGSDLLGNQANALASTISGGSGNIIDAPGAHGVISGGQANRILGTAPTNLNIATIGGGTNNKVLLGGGTIGGGNSNTASGFDATVGGGNSNTASGGAATVPGGLGNKALGDFSFAAGRRAIATSPGCFVWGDSTDADINCTFTNAFSVRASGGVYLRTNAALSTGCDIPAGGGAWSCTSSRETKKDFTAMNPIDVLKRVVELPVTQWRYLTEVSGARHVGPMAEDFHAAFGLGDSNKTINVIDASGVALAAIQGLHALVQSKDHEIDVLKRDLAAIKKKLGLD